MMIQYQRFQLGGRIEEIEVETVASIGKQYILLRDVQDVFPTAARFEREGRPVRFLSDEQGQRLEPWRIAVYLESTLQVIPQPTAKLPMLFFHVVQVVWFLVCVPLKARHSIYQSLFDIHV
ncbi:hypothetical protein KI688_001112 [Linnemannia hyalina]|uniref:Uncharacterized protein n=1 Tax=Linnemannia hyalina TaxID=64524 RepID=A0A9P7Y5J4_9FUNG|nr:hypothetical protein KI688_001112 [Linnemannia hyalina]